MKRVPVIAVMATMLIVTAPIWIPMLLCRVAWAIARAVDELLAEALP